MKVYELAKILNKKSNELLKLIDGVKSINSELSEEQVEEVKSKIIREELESGNETTRIAFVRKSGKIFQLVEANVDLLGNLEITAMKEYESKVRAFHELGYLNGLIEMER
jgi:hypothetical protein